jgi:hypothetical protein
MSGINEERGKYWSQRGYSGFSLFLSAYYQAPPQTTGHQKVA